MIKTVCEKNTCTGCMACLESCSRSAITVIDQLKSYNALIDADKCIECGNCYRICQNNREIEAYEPVAWYQGWSKSDKQRKVSSSGGFAAELMSTFIKSNGVVCSCVFKDGEFCFDFADNLKEVSKFTGSKYVKSTPKGIYKRIRSLLLGGRKVLFIGLPCQVAAVKIFVGEKLLENLYMVDLICHGSPSPKHLEQFLNESGYRLEDLQSISFRKKDVFRIMGNEQFVDFPGVYDCYSLAFLNCINYTENCYSCPYARRERVSDITIGDSWGSMLLEEEQKKGISLALCQSKKGEELLKSADVELFPVDIDIAIQHNHQLDRPSTKPEKYDVFFEALQAGKQYNDAVKVALRRTYINQQIKKVLIKLGFIREIGGGGIYNKYRK